MFSVILFASGMISSHCYELCIHVLYKNTKVSMFIYVKRNDPLLMRHLMSIRLLNVYIQKNSIVGTCTQIY